MKWPKIKPAHKQRGLYDQVEKAKQDGIETVYRHSDSKWRAAAAERLNYLIMNRKTFTSDDILQHLEEKGIVTGDNRAISAIIQSAKRLDLIVATPNFIECRRPTRRHAPVRVWESKVFKLKKGQQHA